MTKTTKNSGNRSATVEKLRLLDDEAKKIRHDLGFSQPQECYWIHYGPESQIVCEADGYGGATVAEVEGSWPANRNLTLREGVNLRDITKRSQKCATEDEAAKLAWEWSGMPDDYE